jgi:hypothetical protein
MAINSKDFSILFPKISTSSEFKDIGMVTGYNMIVQQIEQACLTQKGELMADPIFGSNYYSYKYSAGISIPALENSLKNTITYGVKNIYNVSVKVSSYSDSLIQFNATFSIADGVNKQTMTCSIEVPLI